MTRCIASGAILLTGCVLIVDDDPKLLRVGGAGAGGDAGRVSFPDGTPACLPPFMTGTSATCASCLASLCASEFNACCSDATCRATKRFQSTPLLNAIDTCLSTPCADYCIGIECHSSVGICSCIANSPLPHDEECSVSTVPSAICCASFDWPSDGSCECSERGECPSGLKLLSHCNPP